jgi:tetratricopeptide (TPR) repeat protein
MNAPENNIAVKINPDVFAGICVFAVVFAVFSGAMQNDFVALDDPDFIKNNQMIQSLSFRNLWQMATSLYQGVWHPLTWLSHAIDYRLFQFNPAGHHFTNIVLHSLNAVWVFALFTRLAGEKESTPQARSALLIGGMMVAILFGIHPLRVESVAWVSNRKDLLCAFFILATYLAYLSYVSAVDKEMRKVWYGVTLLLMLLALMSKSMAVTIPVVMLILDFYPLKRWQSFAQTRKLVVEKVPLFALSLLVGTVTFVSLRHMGILVSTVTLSMHDRIFNAFKSVLFYIGKTLWPLQLIPIYPLTGKEEVSTFMFLLPAATVVAMTLAGVWLWRKEKPILPVAWAYYLVTAAPVLGIMQAGRQAAADRYSYLSTLSFYFLIGLVFVRLWAGDSIPSGSTATKTRRAVILLTGAVIMTVLGYMSIQQTKVWRNSEVFWGYIAETVPGGLAVADYNLGQIYQQSGRIREAEAKFKKSSERDPKYVDAHNGLGLLYYEQGMYEEAEAEYKRALAIRSDAIVRNNLGLLYSKQGKLENSRLEFLAAIEMDPKNIEAHNNLGLLYSDMGLLKEAEGEYKAAIKIDFDYTIAHLNLGVLYKKIGALQQAEQELKLGLYLEPEKAEIHSLLGEVYLMQDLPAPAEAEFKEARRLCQEKSKTSKTQSNCDRKP